MKEFPLSCQFTLNLSKESLRLLEKDFSKTNYPSFSEFVRQEIIYPYARKVENEEVKRN